MKITDKLIEIIQADGSGLVFNSNVVPSVEQRNALQKFTQNYISLLKDFQRTIDLRGLEKGRKKCTLLTRLENLPSLFLAGNEEVYKEYSGLRFFANDLLVVKESHSDAFYRLRRKLRKECFNDSWHGVRFEIRIIAALLKRGAGVNSREGPDIQVREGGRDVFVECTLAQLSGGGGDSYVYKIGAAVRKKNAKPYANKNTALFIEKTNVMHHANTEEEYKRLEEIIARLQLDLGIKFGAIILFTSVYVFRGHEFDFGSFYNKVMLDGCAEELRQFVERYYPTNGMFIPGAEYPERP